MHCSFQESDDERSQQTIERTFELSNFGCGGGVVAVVVVVWPPCCVLRVGACAGVCIMWSVLCDEFGERLVRVVLVCLCCLRVCVRFLVGCSIHACDDQRTASKNARHKHRHRNTLGDGQAEAHSAPVSYTHLTLPTIYSV